jgi:hypothetical protein
LRKGREPILRSLRMKRRKRLLRKPLKRKLRPRKMNKQLIISQTII